MPQIFMKKFLLWSLMLFCQTACIEGALIRHSLSDYPDAKCTDGSTAAYFHTEGSIAESARRFVIYLEGGGYCHSIPACEFRCFIAPHLCTTKRKPTLAPGGILSDDPRVNPFHDYYKVDIPYCTSDMFIGVRPASDKTQGFSFYGRQVFNAVLDSLMKNTNILKADLVILSGSSAGGAGVAFNCDYLASILPGVEIRCVVDAAFFYPQIPALHDQHECEIINFVLNLGAKLWYAPSVAKTNLASWWKDIKQPIFIGIARFDKFGIENYCGNQTDLSDLQQWGQAQHGFMNEFLREKPTVGFFMPSCVLHQMLDDNHLFSRFRIGPENTTYAETLVHWVNGTGNSQVWDHCGTALFCNPRCNAEGIKYID